MNAAFVTTKYVALREAWRRPMEKASSWVREHRTALSWATTFVAVAAVGAVMHSHGGWAAWSQTRLAVPWHIGAAVALWPVNLALEVAKWRKLSGFGSPRSWSEAWKEVLAGQTWALLGPFRLADGAGRIVASRAKHLSAVAGAKAFARGAAAQGWATWAWAVVALVVWGNHAASVALGAAVAISGLLLARAGARPSVLALSALRYAVFALQYLLCLTGWGALTTDNMWTEGFPRVASVWCAVSTLPWPAELGVREAVAAWAFDDQLPNVVVATFVLWTINRVGSAALGGFFLTPQP
jgi:hypothetical protein